MSESTLSLKGTKNEEAIAHFLGYGRSASAWTDDQKADIVFCRDEGERQFNHPPATEISPAGYDWTFLHPMATVTLTSGERTVALPDDFGGFESDIHVSLGDQGGFPVLNVTTLGAVQQSYSQAPNVTGRPQLAAERALRGTTLTEGQRFELYVYPEPDQAYVMTFQYWLLPDATSATKPYVRGGAAHASTLQASCIAAAELFLDDQKGPRWGLFMERLVASIIADRKHAPTRIGYNGDRSDDREFRQVTRQGFPPISVGGVLY